MKEEVVNGEHRGLELGNEVHYKFRLPSYYQRVMLFEMISYAADDEQLLS